MPLTYKKLKNQISFTAMYKVVVLLFNYILIALLIDYLGQEKFGIYVALTSLFSWMFLFDLGIAKGMRNFVTIAMSNQNIKEAREYISTAYVSILFITIVSCIIIIIILSFVDLHVFFNMDLKNNFLQNLFFILIVGFFLKFYFSIVDQLNFATHQSQQVALNGMMVVILNFIGVFSLWAMEYKNNVLYVVSVFSISIVVPYFYSTIVFFYRNINLIPSISHFSKKALNNIFGKGSKILFIQIGFLLIVGIDRLILLKYGNALEVSRYEIIYKVMSIVIFPMSIVTAPLWSAFTDAYSRHDIEWIKSVFKKIYIFVLVLLIVILGMTYFFNTITSYWISSFEDVGLEVVFAMGILILSILWSNLHTDFLLGIQNFSFIKKMVCFGLLLKFGLLIYIVLSEESLVIMDVIISSIIAYSLYNISAPFYIKIILKKNKNAYNKKNNTIKFI